MRRIGRSPRLTTFLSSRTAAAWRGHSLHQGDHKRTLGRHVHARAGWPERSVRSSEERYNLPKGSGRCLYASA
jgi:hypothetical protein